MKEVLDQDRPRNRAPKLRWLPAHELTAIQEFGVQGRPGAFLLGLGAIFGIFIFPQVRRATGISGFQILTAWGALSAWFGVANRWLYRRARTSPPAFYGLIFSNVALGCAVCLTFPVVTHHPDTSLWMAFGIMACINGAAEAEPSLILSIVHLVGPLVTIPFFLAQGHPPAQCFAWPVVAAVTSGYGYRFLARRREHWRRDRHEHEMALARSRLGDSERERDRLSRDLHDTVGTALSLVALYGSMAERHAEDPLAARRLAGTIRQSARSGLDDLRAVINALPQRPTTIGELADTLAAVAGRAAQGAGATLRVAVVTGSAVVVSGPFRTAITRICQEAIHNALRHGQARLIVVSLKADSAGTRVIVSDNGVGFDTDVQASGARGLDGIRERAHELGGSMAIESRPGSGTRVIVKLPASPTEASPILPAQTAAFVT